MQEDLVILLEWLNANGIDEFFEEEMAGGESISFSRKEIPTAVTANSSPYGYENINMQNNNTSINGQDSHRGDGKGNLSKTMDRLIRERMDFNLYNPSGSRDVLEQIADDCENIDELVETIKKLPIYENFIRMANSTLVAQNFSEEFAKNSTNKNTNRSNLLIINDFPNREDDISGYIISGAERSLLSNVLQSIKINKNNIYIANLFFWRLPGNRIPIGEEFELCLPFVEKIIALINPKLLIVSGNYGVSMLLEKNKTIAAVKNKIFDYSNSHIYHSIKAVALPNMHMLIKNRMYKRELWNSILYLAGLFGYNIASR